MLFRSLDGVFYRFGIWGIPLATSIVNIVGTVALLFVLRRRLDGRLGFGATAQGVARITAASVVAAGAAFAVWWVVDDKLGRSTWSQIFSLGLAMVAAIDAYLAACLVLKVREISPLLSLRARVRRRR